MIDQLGALCSTKWGRAAWLALGLVISFWGATQVRSTGREQWYTLIVENPQDLENVVSHLEKTPFEAVSSSLLPVTYTSYTEMVSQPLGTLSDRLLKEDRRWDPYLYELIDFFSQPEGERVYFTTTLSYGEILNYLGQIDDQVLWEQAVNPLWLRFPLAIMVLSGLFIVAIFRKKAPIQLLFLILWIPYILLSRDFRSSLLAIPTALFFVALQNEDRPLVRTISSLLLLFLGFLIPIEKGALLYVGEVLLSSFLLSLYGHQDPSIFPQTRRFKVKRPLFNRRTDHALFEPNFFLSTNSRQPSVSLSRSLLVPIVALLLSIPLLVNYPTNDASVEFPSPEGLFHHLYYQENIIYGAQWANSDSVEVTNFDYDEDGGIIEKVSPITSFDQKYIDKKRSEFNRGYASSFLLSTVIYAKKYDFFSEVDFYNYFVFVIILLFSISKIVFPVNRCTSEEKKIFNSNKRGRKIA